MQNLYNPPLPSYSRSVMSAGHNCCTRLYLVHPIFEFIFCLCECKSFCVTSKSPQYHAVCCCSRFFLRKGVKRDAYLRYLTQRILFLRVVLKFFFLTTSHSQPGWDFQMRYISVFKHLIQSMLMSMLKFNSYALSCFSKRYASHLQPVPLSAGWAEQMLFPAKLHIPAVHGDQR